MRLYQWPVLVNTATKPCELLDYIYYEQPGRNAHQPSPILQDPNGMS